jgi:hypothetical protein
MAAQKTSVGLGTPKASFKGKSEMGVGMTVMVIFGFLAALFVFIGIALYSSRQNASALIGGIVMAVVLLILGYVTLYYFGLRFRGLSVQVYEDRLVRSKGSKTETLRWDEIRAVFQSITNIERYGQVVNTLHTYTIETTDGRTLKFSNEIVDIHSLGQIIQTEVTNRLVPKMMQSFNSGETVSFGTFSLNKQGITQGKKSLEWAEIEGAQIDNGVVTFKKQGKWFNWTRVPADKIPNLPTFLTLIDHMVGVKAGR